MEKALKLKKQGGLSNGANNYGDDRESDAFGEKFDEPIVIFGAGDKDTNDKNELKSDELSDVNLLKGEDEKSKTDNEDQWLLGGPLGNRNAVLVFRSSALANSSDLAVQEKPGYKLHITYKVLQAETKLLAKLLDCHGITEVAPNASDFNLLWTGSHPKPGTLRALAPHQRVNHFPRSYELTRKDRLYKNIEKMQHLKGLKHFDFVPHTFVMPTEQREFMSMHHRIRGPWIVKPVASSRGRGIFIVETPNQVPMDEPLVVAKYISNPLLIAGHKCDLRLYVLVTSIDPLLVYIYEEGLVRFATVKYDSSHKQLWNPCMHLCNYSINKYHSDYIKSDDPCAENVGHKWTLSALLRHLKHEGKDTAQLMSQIEDLVIKAILSCANSMISAHKMFVPHPNNCFELYGFDILIDDNLKPWLLEINLSPSLNCDSPLDVRIKSAMLADLLTLVGIPAVDPMLRPLASNTRTNCNIKMRLSNQCRRVRSADGLSHMAKKHSLSNGTCSNTMNRQNSTGAHLQPPNVHSTEEQRIIRNANSQFDRRGGFVRIFPTVDSWSKYSQYLDPITGIPSCGSTSGSRFNLNVNHNYNLTLFTALFPQMIGGCGSMMSSGSKSTMEKFQFKRRAMETAAPAIHAGARKPQRDSSVENAILNGSRQDRYERMLSQGHRSALQPCKITKESHCIELRKKVVDMLRSGRKITQIDARRTFSQYLVCILKRIVTAAPDQDEQADIVLKFLQKASYYLRTPFSVKAPSQKLDNKDRAAVIAHQLHDFLYLYNRETEVFMDTNNKFDKNLIPKPLYEDFLENARECDLEEVLIYQTNNSSSSVPSYGLKSAAGFQGILKCISNTKHDKLSMKRKL